MIEFVFTLEFGATEISTGAWVEKFIQDITREVTLTDYEIREISEKLKENIKTNIFYGKDYTGNTLPTLEASTIKRKGHSKPLYNTGELYRDISVRKIPNGYEVFIQEPRKQVGYWLQTGLFGNNTKHKKFEFFGVTPRQADEAIRETFFKRRVAA